MNGLPRFEFFLDNDVICPRELHYDCHNKHLTINLFIRNDHLKERLGCFKFIAYFNRALTVTVGENDVNKYTRENISTLNFDGWTNINSSSIMTITPIYLKKPLQFPNWSDTSQKIERESKILTVNIEAFDTVMKPVEMYVIDKDMKDFEFEKIQQKEISASIVVYVVDDAVL